MQPTVGAISHVSPARRPKRAFVEGRMARAYRGPRGGQKAGRGRLDLPTARLGLARERLETVPAPARMRSARQGSSTRRANTTAPTIVAATRRASSEGADDLPAGELLVAFGVARGMMVVM
ncbi:MAG: hypothetical protein OHK0013_16400 [Sandaracinaceae bacterium]